MIIKFSYHNKKKVANPFFNSLKIHPIKNFIIFFKFNSLKTQLCSYFNVNGIPYMTLIEFKLDTRKGQFKIVDFRCDKRNIKHDFLADPNGVSFPWFKAAASTTTPSSNIITSQNGLLFQQQEESMPVSKSKIRNIDEIFNQDETNTHQIVIVSDVDQTVTSSTSAMTAQKQILKEILDNLEPTKVRDNLRVRSSSASDTAMLAQKDYIFVLFGSRELKTNSAIVQSIVEFWRRFHKKHRFFVVYLEFNNSNSKIDPKSTQLSVNLSSVEWFTISKIDVKVKRKKHKNF